MNFSPLHSQRGARRLLGAGVLALLAGSVVLPAQAAPSPGDGPGGHRAHRMGHPGDPLMAALPSDRALEAVGASAEQRAQIRQIVDGVREDLRSQREAGRALHRQMRELFTQPTVDANVAEALRRQQLARHDQVSQRLLQAMLDVSRVLTPEQRAKLAEQRGKAERRHERRERAGEHRAGEHRQPPK